jgi:ataxin-10
MNTPHDVVTALAAMGLPRLLLGLTAALPPPMGAGNTSKARGPTAAPRLDPDVVGGPAALRDGHAPFPTARPWPGYRVDALAPLANAMFNRPGVCDQVVKLGGVPIILAATRGEDGEDFLREWALWATRNLCHGSEDARKEIESMQPEAAADSQELAAMGLNVSVDPATGKVRVKSIGKEGGAGERYDGVGTGGGVGGGGGDDDDDGDGDDRGDGPGARGAPHDPGRGENARGEGRRRRAHGRVRRGPI